jgi:phage-related tail protein
MANEEIKSLAVKIAMENSSFNAGVSSLKTQLNVINSEFKAGVSGVKDWGTNIDSLKSNAAALGEKISVQKQIVSSYVDQLQKSKDVLEGNSQKMIDLKSKIESSKSAWEQSKSAIGANAEATQKLKVEHENLNRQYTSSEGLILKNSKSIDGYKIQLNNAKSSLGNMELELKNNEKTIKNNSFAWLDLDKKVKGAGTSFGDVIKGAAKIGVAIAAGVGIAVGAVSGLVMKSAEAAESIQLMSEKYSMTTDRVQELQYVSKNLGMDIDTINGAQSKLTKTMFAAKDPMSAQAAIFDELKVKVKDVNGNLRDSKTVMGEAIDKLGKMENGTERDALSMKIFGKSAMELNPLIKAGSVEIAKFSDEAHKNGAVMSTESVEGLAKFKKGFESAKQSVTGMLGELAGKFSPYLDKFQLWFTEKMPEIKKSITDAIDIIVPKFQQWMGLIGDIIKELFPNLGIQTDGVKDKVSGFKSVLDVITGVLLFVRDNINIVKAALVLAGAVWAIQTGFVAAHNTVLFIHNTQATIAAVQSGILAVAHGVQSAALAIATAAQEAFNFAMSANPIGLIITALALLGLAIYEVVKHWKDICEWIEKAWNWLTKWNNTGIAEKSSDTKVADIFTPATPKKTGFPGFASGIENFRGGLARINENGGEIVTLPNGASVIPHDLSKQLINSTRQGNNGAMSSGGVTINVKVGTLVGSNGMNEFATIISQKLAGHYGLLTGGTF